MDDLWRRLAGARVARLATVTPEGAPVLVPVTFAVVGETIYHAVDHKPKTTRRLARLANIAGEPRVALLADEYDEDWSRLWWVRADGRARVLEDAPEAIDRLVEKYPQYAEHRPEGPVVALAVERITGWAANGTARTGRARPAPR
jgi:PPOX class probable F420-dependent enzyme